MSSERPEAGVSMRGQVPSMVATAAITAAVTIFGSYFAMQRDAKASVPVPITAPAPPAPANCLTKDDFTAYMLAREVNDRDWKDRMRSDLYDIKARLGIVEQSKK